jgi:hypothetical protein
MGAPTSVMPVLRTMTNLPPYTGPPAGSGVVGSGVVGSVVEGVTVAGFDVGPVVEGFVVGSVGVGVGAGSAQLLRIMPISKTIARARTRNFFIILPYLLHRIMENLFNCLIMS